MSIVSGCINICNAIQMSLEDVAGTAAPTNKRTQTGLLQSLVSPLNNGSQIRVDQGDGHRRAVEVHYTQRMVEDQVDDTPTTTCVSANPYCERVTDYDIALYSEIDMFYEEADVARMCKGNGDVFGIIINDMFEAIQRKINANLIAAAATKFGINQATGLAAKTTLDIYDNATGAVNPAVWNTFKDQLINSNQFQGNPLIVAGSTFFKANSSLKFSCCNTDGLDMLMASQQSGYGFFNDQMIDTTLGGDEAIVYEPGAAKFVTYYEYRDLGNPLKTPGTMAAFTEVDGGYRGMVRDPRGITYNIDVFYDRCTKQYHIFIFLNYDLFVLPVDMYKAGDPLEGSNSFLYFEFT